MKGLIAITLMLIVTTASAHRPRIVDCDIFAKIGQEAAMIRDDGKPLQEAMDHLNKGHRFNTYIESYRVLVKTVYESPDLQNASPDITYQAAHLGCRKHNDEERRTRELD